ncbi:MAG: AraC family ligand binding domain-containing protein [Flavobacteriaceae bacterium]|jgi:rmlC-like cupin family protein|nr:AraC family ligand binding domain-containing protein [Flavobacteriaceae bacterium]MBB1561512.1 AraC family ligand binding domain-containing protein [Flavobacteriaceae bacterium]MBB1575232.1 AraC family ligand binding domain-containing protein [Flavobacteriaceae bacterium]RKW62859.1 MAG: cupin [Riemerella sp.]
MKTASIYQDLEFNENKPAIKAILETDFTKEIRILMRENQEMKEHQTPFPIVVELLEGEIIFGVEGQNYEVKKGDLLTLSGGVPHNLIAKKESVIRLTLSKLDSSKRVEGVAEKS